MTFAHFDISIWRYPAQAMKTDARAREQNRRLLIVRGSSAVQRLFEVTKLAEQLEMIDEEAGLPRPLS